MGRDSGGGDRVRALEARIADLERELREVDEFLSFAAHELRTPATSIEGYAYLLGRNADDKSGDMRQRCVEGIARNAGRLVALVSELLDIGRARGGRLSIAREPCDLAALARDARADEVRVGGAPVVVEADRRRLLTLLHEMVLDARERARGRGRVRIEVLARDGEAIAEVSDPAPAVGVAHLERAFLGGRRAGGVEDGDGARGGLGLLLGREVVVRLGGRTYVRSGAEGNVLGIALPLAG